MGIHANWPDDSYESSWPTFTVKEVLAVALGVLLTVAALIFMLWYSDRVDDGLDRVPTRFPEETSIPDR